MSVFEVQSGLLAKSKLNVVGRVGSSSLHILAERRNCKLKCDSLASDQTKHAGMAVVVIDHRRGRSKRRSKIRGSVERSANPAKRRFAFDVHPDAVGGVEKFGCRADNARCESG